LVPALLSKKISFVREVGDLTFLAFLTIDLYKISSTHQKSFSHAKHCKQKRGDMPELNRPT
jgi:hypothetical protein